MKYNVTIPYLTGPWYTITGIEAANPKEAKQIGERQARLENGVLPHRAIYVEEES